VCDAAGIVTFFLYMSSQDASASWFS
jgi:hypothetical protein